jgi:flagellar M-ring protein FliF
MKSVTVKIRIARAKETDSPRSEVQRQTVRQAGAIRRISVAVLVDGITSAGPDGQPVWAPRPAEELKALRDLITAAVGFDEARGDVVTVESMAFESDATPGALVETSWWLRLLERNAMTLIQIGVLAVVCIVLALTVIRPLLARPPVVAYAADGRPGEAELIAGQPEGAAALPAPDEGTDREQTDGELQRLSEGEALRLAISEQPERSVAMIREWLANDEDEAA